MRIIELFLRSSIIKLVILIFGFQSQSIYSQSAILEDLKAEFEKSLHEDILKVWYPRTIDTIYGGFLSDFDSEWKLSEPQNKMLVTQTRHVWTLSKLADFFESEYYKDLAAAGYEFLKDKMFDSADGGFYLMRNRQGEEIPSWSNQKSSYSISFSIYALAAYFKTSNDSSALDLAKLTFNWLDQKAHDDLNGGYFDLLDKKGDLISNIKKKNGDKYLVQSNWKDQNSSIHLLEAFTEFYSVWNEPLLKKRLEEMLNIIRDKIVGEKNFLTLYLQKNWVPITFRDSISSVRDANHHLDHVSFGHDVETAFLMLEASHELGYENDDKTLQKAKAMVDHALNYGWDSKNGGFYYEGYYFPGDSAPKIINQSKVWWVQAEGLNALLLMSKLFSNEKKYFENFLLQWKYIKNYLIDYENGGWYEEGLDISPNIKNAPKAQIWKVNYHNVRTLVNCIKMLDEINNED